MVELIRKLLKKIEYYFMTGYSVYKQYRQGKRIIFRVLEIDDEASIVVFQVKGKSAILKLAIDQVINSHGVVRGLSPLDASTIGVLYGRMIRAKNRQGSTHGLIQSISLKLTNKYGDYEVAYQDREEKIFYLDKRTKKGFLEHPITIVQNKHIISKFNSLQACYLGILAGISLEKSLSKGNINNQNNVIDLFKKKTKLRVIN